MAKNELEQKFDSDYELNLSWLGVDGWVLRTLPQNLRIRFLESHKKNLQTTHHPDLYQNSRERKTHENYLQRVTATIDYFLSNPIELELALQDLPSTRDPMIALKQKIKLEQREKEELEKRLSLERKEHERTRVKLSEIRHTTRAYSSSRKAPIGQTPKQNIRVKAYNLYFGEGKIEDFILKLIKPGTRNYTLVDSLKKMALIRTLKKRKRNAEIYSITNLKFENGIYVPNAGQKEVHIIGSLGFDNLRQYLSREWVNGRELKNIQSGQDREKLRNGFERLFTFLHPNQPAIKEEYEKRVLPYLQPRIILNSICIMEEEMERSATRLYRPTLIVDITEQRQMLNLEMEK